MGVATSTPFDMVALNDLDRSYRVADVIDRVPKLGARATYTKQAIRDTLLEHTQYITEYGEDLPEVRHWKGGDEDCNVSRTTKSLTSICLTAP